MILYCPVVADVLATDKRCCPLRAAARHVFRVSSASPSGNSMSISKATTGRTFDKVNATMAVSPVLTLVVVNATTLLVTTFSSVHPLVTANEGSQVSLPGLLANNRFWLVERVVKVGNDSNNVSRVVVFKLQVPHER